MAAKLNAPACFHGGAGYNWIGDDFSNKHFIGQVIDSDVLDAWFDPSPKAMETLRESLAWTLRSSPPVHPTGMLKAISRKIDVDESNIACGAGSSSLMFLALRELLSSDSRVLILDPTYGEYAHICANVIGCKVEFFKLNSANDFVVDLSMLAQVVSAGDYDMVFIVNPNNPSGKLIAREQLEVAIKAFPVETNVWVDEAYIDYAGAEHSLATFAATRKNVFVCKSLSKVLALSGLRVAYLVSDAQFVERLKLLTAPWSLSLPAQLVVIEALNDPGYYLQCYATTKELRCDLHRELAQLGFSPIEGTANFLLVEYSSELPVATKLIEACRAQNLLLRNVRSMGSATSAHCFRITVKDASTNARMIAILAGVLRK